MYQSQIQILKNYDIIDITTRISALTLDYRNQNVAFMLNGLVDELTESDRSSFQSSTIISDKKFRNVIESLSENEQLQMIVDPCENLFTQRVIFFQNHIVFNGIDNEPAYKLQLVFDTFHIFENEYRQLADEFPTEFYKLANVVLLISDTVADQMGNMISFQKSPGDREPEIYIPDGQTIRKQKTTVTFSGYNIRTLLDDENVFWSMVLPFGHKPSVDDRNRRIYSHPFLYDEDSDRLILLDPALLPQFLIYSFVMLADKAGIKERIIRDFNSIAFSNALKSFSKLGHYCTDVKKRWDIDLMESDAYKEAILAVGTNRFIFFTFLGDDGNNYGEDTIHGELSQIQGDTDEAIRLRKVREVLQEQQHIDGKSIYHIVCLNSIGRGLMFEIYHGGTVSDYHVLELSPFELYCVSVNERDHEGFIPRYIRAKFLKRYVMPSLFSEMNEIAAYDANQYSFYVTDERPIENVITVSDHGDSLGYIKRALDTTDKRVVRGFKPHSFLEVELVDPVRRIYTVEFYRNRITSYIDLEDSTADEANYSTKSNSKGIWLISDEFAPHDKERFNTVYTSFDILQYWLGECRKAFCCIPYDRYPLIFSISVEGKGEEILNVNTDNAELPVSDVSDVDFTDHGFVIHWTLKLKDYLVWHDNSHEREMIRWLIQTVSDKLGNRKKKYKTGIDNVVERAFWNPLKRKIYFADLCQNPSNRPPVSNTIYLVHEEDDEYVHDTSGPELVRRGIWAYGKLNGDDRSKALNAIVSFLYDELEENISELSPEGLVEEAYRNIEALLYRILLDKANFAHDIACNPEKKRELLDKYNDYNRSLQANKFFLEYISACPPKGKKQFDSFQYEYLLSICSSIIVYAYQSDFYRYHLSDKTVEILPSGRFAADHEAMDSLYGVTAEYRDEELQYYSANENVKSEFLGWTFSPEMEAAFLETFGYTDKDFINVILSMADLWSNDGKDVHVYPREDVEEKIVESGISDKERIAGIIDSISLSKRNDFLVPLDGFEKTDLWPWRYNRRLSFTMRPLIRRQTDNGTEELIWGDRSVYRMLQFMLYSIEGSTYPVKTGKLKKLMGKFSDERGQRFNDIITESISGMNYFKVYPNVKKINRKPIADEKGNTLGDIDVLLIDEKNHFIFPVEVKSFKVARCPYEIHIEHMSLFEDSGKKKCFVSKHARRVRWITAHIPDVVKQYGLETSHSWKVRGLFVVDQAQISNEAYHENIPMLSRPQLTLENLIKMEI